MSIGKDLVDIIKGNDNKGTKPYDTSATVTRVEDSTVWVHIPGGVDETPVKKTISAKEGDVVQVRVSGGSAWLNGNASAPPTDDATAVKANATADVAYVAAENAVNSANQAAKAAASAEQSAQTAYTAATNAQSSATAAQTSADSALVSLSTVEDVVGVLNWITAHGTMTLTSDVAVNPAHVYFVIDPAGDYVVGGTHYSIVAEPDVADIGTYYELSVDESVQNYVATHLAVDTEGLWLIPDSGGNKVLIATGAGSTYTTAGTYLIGKVNGLDTVFAKFTQNGATMTTNDSNNNLVEIANLGYGIGTSESGTATTPYYTLGTREPGSKSFPTYSSSNTYAKGAHCTYNGTKYICRTAITTPEAFNSNHWQPIIGNYSIAEGEYLVASGGNSHAEGRYTEANGYCSHAEGGPSGSPVDGPVANGNYAHAEGTDAEANGTASHAEGAYTRADGNYSHSQNRGTKANGADQTALGKFNVADTTNAVIIGNGTADNARSNALTVDWSGNVNIASGAKYKINGTALAASDVSALSTSDKYTRSSAGGLDWVNQTDGDAKVIMKSALAFWNGTYNGSGSNLSKCSSGDIIGSNGGTMTGQLKTSFKTSVAMGSYGSAQTTVDGLAGEVRYSSGCSGSASIGTAYTKNGITIPTGWYNFMYMPHRSGGLNGGADGDNANYGNLFLFGMNNANGRFIVRISSGTIQEICKLVTTIELNQTPSTSGLSGYSSRCTISNGGIYTIGNQVFVTMKLKIAAALSANNYWTLVQGLPTPSYEQALACSGISLNGTALSAYVTTSGQIVVATDNAALANGNYITVTGWYLKA